MSELVNVKVNSSNHTAVLASNYATRIRGRHAALRECIMYKVICLTRKTMKLHMHSDSFCHVKQHKHGSVCSLHGFTWLPIDKKSIQFFFQEPPYFFLVSCSCRMKLDMCE